MLILSFSVGLLLVNSIDIELGLFEYVFEAFDSPIATFFEILFNLFATDFAAFPLIPVSISSNIKTGTLSTSANTLFIASIILDISPPEAILAIGCNAIPLLTLKRKIGLS